MKQLQEGAGILWAIKQINQHFDKVLEQNTVPAGRSNASGTGEPSTPALITPRRFKSVEEFIEWDAQRNAFNQSEPGSGSPRSTNTNGHTTNQNES